MESLFLYLPMLGYPQGIWKQNKKRKTSYYYYWNSDALTLTREMSLVIFWEPNLSPVDGGNTVISHMLTANINRRRKSILLIGSSLPIALTGTSLSLAKREDSNGWINSLRSNVHTDPTYTSDYTSSTINNRWNKTAHFTYNSRWSFKSETEWISRISSSKSVFLALNSYFTSGRVG